MTKGFQASGHGDRPRGIFLPSSESGAAGASHYRGIPEGDARQSADLDGEKRKNHAGYLYGGAGCCRHISQDMELVQDMGFAKEHFLSDVKAKEAALRAGMED